MTIPTTQRVRLSEKQEAFIRVLLDERVVPDEKRAVIGDPHTLDKQAASKVIEYLTALPKKVMAKATTAMGGGTQPQYRWRTAAPAATQATPPTITAEGMYQLGSDIYRVQRSRTGHLFAELLNQQTGGFTYAKGKVYDLRPEHRMTIDQAKAYGIKWGRCCVCGKTLTDPVSMAQGIGPICVKGKYFTAANTPAAPAHGQSVTP